MTGAPGGGGMADQAAPSDRMATTAEDALPTATQVEPVQLTSFSANGLAAADEADSSVQVVPSNRATNEPGCPPGSVFAPTATQRPTAVHDTARRLTVTSAGTGRSGPSDHADPFDRCT